MSYRPDSQTARRFWPAAALIAGGLLFASAFVVGAEPLEPVTDVLGLHGQTVSQAAHDAQLPNNERDGGNGPAVSEAVCEVAHKTPKEDCTHPLNAGSEDSDAQDNTDEAVTEETEDESSESGDEVVTQETNHGQQVSQAVHEAKQNAVTEGGKVGRAVALAACQINHGEESDICARVGGGDEAAESETDASVGTAKTRGRDGAPGQVKKQGD